MYDDALATKKRLPSKKVNQGVASKEDRGLELYPTPPQLTTALIKSGEPLPEIIWEPACGMGHMARPLNDAGYIVYCSDIYNYGWSGQHAQFDFLTTDRTPKVWYKPGAIITNPPFSYSASFVRHGLKIVPKVIILNRLAFLEGRERRDIIDGHLTRVYPIVERPPMMHRWVRGVWKHPADGKPFLVEDDGIWREWSGKKAPSAMACAWFVFEREKKTPTTLHRISWRCPVPVL